MNQFYILLTTVVNDRKGKQTCHTKVSTKHSLKCMRHTVCPGVSAVHVQLQANSCPGADVI